MSLALAIPLFAASAVLTLAAAGFFADKLDHVGPRLGLPESAVGLLTAVAADTPEIASAIVALISGNKDASLGVVLGSNVFNLAAMIGLSAVLAGAVSIGAALPDGRGRGERPLPGHHRGTRSSVFSTLRSRSSCSSSSPSRT